MLDFSNLKKCLKNLKNISRCPGRDSNPHSHFGPRDFKSLVSTIPPPGRDRKPTVKRLSDNIRLRRSRKVSKKRESHQISVLGSIQGIKMTTKPSKRHCRKHFTGQYATVYSSFVSVLAWKRATLTMKRSWVPSPIIPCES